MRNRQQAKVTCNRGAVAAVPVAHSDASSEFPHAILVLRRKPVHGLFSTKELILMAISAS
jgi:hypothetical protein